MGLFEWIGEWFDPGDVGTLELGTGASRPRSVGVVLVCFIVAAALLAGWLYFAVRMWGADALPWIALGTFAYLLLGFLLRPEPDTSNIGWLGGAMDDPFRWSDDINRLLLFLLIVLWPGRFVAQSFVNVLPRAP